MALLQMAKRLQVANGPAWAACIYMINTQVMHKCQQLKTPQILSLSSLPASRCISGRSSNFGASPVYPRTHRQVNPPDVLMQAALDAHPAVPRTHSSMSMLQFGPSYLHQHHNKLISKVL